MPNLGEKVQWTKQAQGKSKTKVGEIVGIVAAGARPDRERFADLYRCSFVGAGRDHESYVVRVGKRYYWPRANQLVSANQNPDDLKPSNSCSGFAKEEYTRLINWMKDSRRQPANTAFTAGHVRDAARAFEDYQESRKVEMSTQCSRGECDGCNMEGYCPKRGDTALVDVIGTAGCKASVVQQR